jgi:hypothetical protein
MWNPRTGSDESIRLIGQATLDENACPRRGRAERLGGSYLCCFREVSGVDFGSKFPHVHSGWNAMAKPLEACAQYLSEVNTLIIELLDTSTDTVERGRLREALSFVEEAMSAVSQMEETLKPLPKTSRGD